MFNQTNLIGKIKVFILPVSDGFCESHNHDTSPVPEKPKALLKQLPWSDPSPLRFFRVQGKKSEQILIYLLP